MSMFTGGYSNSGWEDGGSSRQQQRRSGRPEVGPGAPHRIWKSVEEVGKTVASSKKRCTWRFSFGDEGDAHTVVLEHSTLSGRKRLYLNDEMIFESQKISSMEWSHGWRMGNHVCRCDLLGEGAFQLSIDARPFSTWPRVDSQLADQLKAAKADSEKTLREDEQRRFDMIQSGGGGGSSSRGKTGGASPDGPRRSSNSGGTRRKSGGSPPKLKSGTSTTTSSSSTGTSAAAAAATLDILSADLPAPGPRGFDPFAASTTTAAGGGSSSNSNDAALVLQLGMQFEAMGVDYHALYSQQQQQQQQQGGDAQDNFFGNEQQQQQQPQQNAAPGGAAGGANGAADTHQRQRTLDQDLWKVAAVKDFVNMDDLTGQKQKVSVRPLTQDSRTLGELASSSSNTAQSDAVKRPSMLQYQDPQLQQQQPQQGYYQSNAGMGGGSKNGMMMMPYGQQQPQQLQQGMPMMGTSQQGGYIGMMGQGPPRPVMSIDAAFSRPQQQPNQQQQQMAMLQQQQQRMYQSQQQQPMMMGMQQQQQPQQQYMMNAGMQQQQPMQGGGQWGANNGNNNNNANQGAYRGF